jgi:CDP-glucose 4,6-dehydratase
MESLVMTPDGRFWRGRRVLLTGQSGFKGCWLARWLWRLGANVTGIALPPAGSPSLYKLARVGQWIDSQYCDLRDHDDLANRVSLASPEIVFHLAAQPLVRRSYREPLVTFATNVMGTAHLLDALRRIDSPKAAIVVSTDKVYAGAEWPYYPYRETDPLGGHDPYSASKAASEIITGSYSKAFLRDRGLAVGAARAGNVIGGGDWSEDRLIPDALRAWQSGVPLRLRNPHAVRPWQHVLEPLAAYLVLAERLHQMPDKAGAYNFGPDGHEVATVEEIAHLASTAYGEGEVISQQESDGPHEEGWLALETAKARAELGVRPRWRLQTAVEKTMHWYREWKNGADALSLCDADIDDFESTK